RQKPFQAGRSSESNRKHYFNSSFSSLARRPPASATRHCARFPALFLYSSESAYGPSPGPIGGAYTAPCASLKLSAIQSFSSIFATSEAIGFGSFRAFFSTLLKSFCLPSKSSQKKCSSHFAQSSLTRFPPASPSGSALLTRVEACNGW